MSPSFEVLQLLRKRSLLYHDNNFSLGLLNFFLTNTPCDFICVCLFLFRKPLEPLQKLQYPGKCAKESVPARVSEQKKVQGSCWVNCGDVHFLLYFKFLFRNFLELVFWSVILTSMQEGMAFQPAFIFQKFMHLKATTNIISRVQFARTMSPLFCCCEISYLSNSICHISLESPALIVDIVQSNHRVSPKDHSLKRKVQFLSHCKINTCSQQSFLQLKARNADIFDRGIPGLSYNKCTFYFLIRIGNS